MDDERFGIDPKAMVTVTQMKHLVEVQYMERMNTTNHIKKLDKDRYLDKRTGEVKEFNHIENRYGSINSLRQTFKKIRYLINNNFEGLPNELHVTLTYAENMTDTKQLYEDVKNFVKRLKYNYKDKTTIDYLNVVEPQGRGAWHCHMLVRFNDVNTIYIPPAELAELWGHGFIKIKSLKDVDNVGAYLSAYLTDLEINLEQMDLNTISRFSNSEFEVLTKVVDGKEKKFIKGGRLHMYPPGMNLYRKSRGILFPERPRMRYKDIKKVVQSAEPNYHKVYNVQSEDFENTIAYEQYNLKR